MKARGFQQQSPALLEDSACHDELGGSMDLQMSTQPCLGFLQPCVFQLGRINAMCVSVLHSRSLPSNSLVIVGLALAG